MKLGKLSLKCIILTAVSLHLHAGEPPHSKSPQGPLDSASEESQNEKKSFVIPFGYYTPETKLALGFLGIKNLWKERQGKTSSVISSASLTSLGQSIFNIAPRLYFNQGKYELGGILFYSYFPSKYYGKGLFETLDKPEDFLENTFISGFNAGYNFIDAFYIRSAMNYETRRSQEYTSNGRLDQEVAAKNIAAKIYTISLEWDQRDYPQAPTSGRLYRLTALFNNSENRETSKSIDSFQKYDLETKEYIPFGESKVLALQLLLSEIQGSEAIPFQNLNSIGGGARLRGFYNGRYRAKALLMSQVEARWEFRDRWVAAMFVGGARLGSKMQNIFETDQSRLFASGGLGIHYVIDKENRTKFRFDIGGGAEKLGVYVLIGEAF